MSKNLSVSILIYGLYSVLCHAAFILFSALTSGISSSAALTIRYAPMLEHTFMSMLIVAVGAFLTEITVQKHG